MAHDGGQVMISDARYAELTGKEMQLEALLASYPELTECQPPTRATKKYKVAFAAFVKRVDEVLSSEEIKSMFQIAYIHGFTYKGPSLAKDIELAKKLLGQ